MINRSEKVNVEILKEYLGFIDYKLIDVFKGRKFHIIDNNGKELKFLVEHDHLNLDFENTQIYFFFSDCSIVQISEDTISLFSKEQNDSGIFINISKK